LRPLRLPSLKDVARRSKLGRSLLPAEMTDLGLALTKCLVELHGCRIWTESEAQGKGSIFAAFLPFVGLQAAGDPWSADPRCGVDGPTRDPTRWDREARMGAKSRSRLVIWD
jgi:hypothetical protein